MTFDWDQHNRSKVNAHGLTVEEAETIWSDPLGVTGAPQEHSGEMRQKTVGSASGKRGVVVWTQRETRVRIVTAWWESRIRRTK